MNVSSTSNWGWWDFYLTATNPDGTTETKHLSKFKPFAGTYNLHLQYYYLEVTNAYLNVDIFLGLSPLNAQFDTAMAAGDGNQTGYYTPIGFSNAVLETTVPCDATIYKSTEQEWNDQENNSITALLKQGAKDLFSWTWDMALGLFAKIPYIGPSIVGILTLTAFLANETIFYATLLLQNIDVIFLIIEAFIGLDALKARSIDGIFKKLVRNHIKLIEKTIDFGTKIVSAFSNIISAIAEVIQTLKPL